MIFIFEGMDNCLKDTLIQELRHTLSPETQVLKFSNPPKNLQDPESYQRRHFRDMFNLLELNLVNSDRNIILNRAHLGEYVYSPIYRGYKAEWIFDLEREFLRNSKHSSLTILILLYDSNNEQLILREDGHSLSRSESEKLSAERESFIEAFNKSLFPLKIEFDLSKFYLEGLEQKKNVNTKLIFEKIISSTF